MCDGYDAKENFFQYGLVAWVGKMRKRLKKETEKLVYDGIVSIWLSDFDLGYEMIDAGSHLFRIFFIVGRSLQRGFSSVDDF